jgi:hypothetical protein
MIRPKRFNSGADRVEFRGGFVGGIGPEEFCQSILARSSAVDNGVEIAA